MLLELAESVMFIMRPGCHHLAAFLQDHGCAGGLMDFAFSFIIRNGGLDTEKDYKYKAADGVCNINKEKKHVVTIDSYEDVPPNDEGALKKVTCPVIFGELPHLPAAACHQQLPERPLSVSIVSGQ